MVPFVVQNKSAAMTVTDGPVILPPWRASGGSSAGETLDPIETGGSLTSSPGKQPFHIALVMYSALALCKSVIRSNSTWSHMQEWVLVFVAPQQRRYPGRACQHSLHNLFRAIGGTSAMM